MTLFIVGLIVFIASVFTTAAFLGLWTYKDAQVKSDQPAGIWALAAMFISFPVGLIAYLLVGRTKKDVPAPGTYKTALIVSIVVFALALPLFVCGTVRFATGDYDFGGNTPMNRGVWAGRTVNTANSHLAETSRSRNATSRRTITLNAEQMQNFHVDSTSTEGRLYLEFEQGANFSSVDISYNFLGTIDLLQDHGFEPGRIRVVLRYEHTRNAEIILNWRRIP